MTTEENNRREFEEWAAKAGYILSNMPSKLMTDFAWEAWQASRELPQRDRDEAREELAGLNEEYGTWWAQKRIALDELKDVTEQRDEARFDLDFRRRLGNWQNKIIDDRTEQRDRLAEALTRIIKIYENPEKGCIPSSSDMYDEALQSLTTNEL